MGTMPEEYRKARRLRKLYKEHPERKPNAVNAAINYTGEKIAEIAPHLMGPAKIVIGASMASTLLADTASASLFHHSGAIEKVVQTAKEVFSHHSGTVAAPGAAAAAATTDTGTTQDAGTGYSSHPNDINRIDLSPPTGDEINILQAQADRLNNTGDGTVLVYDFPGGGLAGAAGGGAADGYKNIWLWMLKNRAISGKSLKANAIAYENACNNGGPILDISNDADMIVTSSVGAANAIGMIDDNTDKATTIYRNHASEIVTLSDGHVMDLSLVETLLAQNLNLPGDMERIKNGNIDLCLVMTNKETMDPLVIHAAGLADAQQLMDTAIGQGCCLPLTKEPDGKGIDGLFSQEVTPVNLQDLGLTPNKECYIIVFGNGRVSDIGKTKPNPVEDNWKKAVWEYTSLKFGKSTVDGVEASNADRQNHVETVLGDTKHTLELGLPATSQNDLTSTTTNSLDLGDGTEEGELYSASKGIWVSLLTGGFEMDPGETVIIRALPSTRTGNASLRIDRDKNPNVKKFSMQIVEGATAPENQPNYSNGAEQQATPDATPVETVSMQQQDAQARQQNETPATANTSSAPPKSGIETSFPVVMLAAAMWASSQIAKRRIGDTGKGPQNGDVAGKAKNCTRPIGEKGLPPQQNSRR